MTKLNEKIMKKAISESYGNLSYIAESCGCARQTVYEFLKKHKELDEMLWHERQVMIDIAENRMLAQIKIGNMTAISLILKTIGRDRGYIEHIINETVEYVPRDKDIQAVANFKKREKEHKKKKTCTKTPKKSTRKT